MPPPFNIPTTGVTEAALGEMKQAIEAAKNDLKSWQSKLEAAHAEAAKTGSNAAALRAERDKLFRSVAALKAKGQEREKAVTAAKTAEERQLARERLTNAKLEARVEDLRLKILEATQGRETSLAEVRQLNERVVDAQVQVSRKLLDQMQRRYRVLAESQQRDLQRAAATEENKAQQSDDPLDRYRARRLAELLELEAQVVKHEQSLATSSRPSLEEERALADRAESEFAQIKQLLDDGNVSRLDALRLNNDFRRIGPERDGLLRNELSSIETQLQYFENMLTGVELELIEDSLADQAEHDALLERLAPATAYAGQEPFRRAGEAAQVAAGTAAGCPDQAGRPRLGDAEPGDAAAPRARGGVRIHPDPYLLGPRSGADRHGNSHAGRARAEAAARGAGQAGPRGVREEGLGAALDRVPDRGGRRDRPAPGAVPAPPPAAAPDHEGTPAQPPSRRPGRDDPRGHVPAPASASDPARGPFRNFPREARRENSRTSGPNQRRGQGT